MNENLARLEEAASAQLGPAVHHSDRRAPLPDEETPNPTDAGNALRFARHNREAVRWCPQWKVWLVWDGKRWAKDTQARVMQYAKQTARSILDEARHTDDDERRRKLTAWAATSENVKRLQAMLELAKSEDGLSVEPNELNRDTWLLNVRNGTIDLRTGTLLPHDRARLITKLVPIDYDATAACPLWRTFLTRILNRDDELLGFLQVAFGYSMTGSVRERVIFLLHGKGKNGKTTLVNVLLLLAGDEEYGIPTPSETLLASRRDGGVRNDLARFAGVRVVAAMESDQGRKLAPALIKQLTGGDPIPARFLFGEFFTINPTWKIWFSTNHRPAIDDHGDAIWDRVKLIPFGVCIPDHEQDKQLFTKLTAELPGILAWAVQGCLRWQRDGLGCPAAVRVATETYRQDENVFNHFLSERCVCEPQAMVKFADLRAAYVMWVEEAADRPMTSKAFAAALQERGFTPIRSGNARHYVGVRLRGVTDDVADAQRARDEALHATEEPISLFEEAPDAT